MKRFHVLVMLIIAVIAVLCSCTFMVGPLDRKAGFSARLEQLEDNIRNERWIQAEVELKHVNETWRKIKPWIQIDIDHDYVHELEENLAKLEGYIDTEEKAESLGTILMLNETWEDITSL